MVSESGEPPAKRIIPNFHPLLPIPPIGLHVDDEDLYEFDAIEREVFLQNKQKRLTQPSRQDGTLKVLAEKSISPSQHVTPPDGWDTLQQVSAPIIGTLSTKHKQRKG